MGEYKGICHGGPLDGVTMTSRCPKGFLLVNRPAEEIAIYEFQPSGNAGSFHVRQDELGRWEMLEITDESERKNRYRAALEPNYDLFAYDPEEMPPWEA